MVWPGEGPPTVIAPIFVGYDYTFGPDGADRAYVLALARELDRLAQELAACSPVALLSEEERHHEGTKSTKEG